MALNSGTVGQETSLSQVGQAQAPESAQTSSIKVAVQKRGVSQRAQVKVKLRDGRQIVVHISKIDDALFEVSNKAVQITQIQYTDAEKITRAGLRGSQDRNRCRRGSGCRWDCGCH